jgi:hypothetical protein
MLTSTASRLAAFAAGLALLGAGAAAVGAATDATPPFQDCLKVAAADAGFGEGEMAGEGMTDETGDPMVEAVPGADGLLSELAGLSLAPRPAAFGAGRTTTWRFRILGCDGEPIRDFEPEQGKLLHLIVVRSDFTGYQHLHPALAADGTFSVDVATPRPGRYRAIADFVVDGRKYVVATDLTAPGRAAEAPLPRPSLHASVDGYDVELQRPAVLEAGGEASLTFRITRRGRPVADLEPYLGAYGHLVALHAPDLGYSHVHPDGEDRASGAITFDAELHEHGTYRLFLQFQTRGRVHTAGFTQTAS